MALEWEDTSHPAPDLKVIGRVLGRGYGEHIALGEQAGIWHLTKKPTPSVSDI